MVRQSIPTPKRLAMPSFSRDELAAMAESLRLSPRQAQIVGLLLQGRKDKQIAQALNLTIRTVREHLSRIFLRAGATDRLELVLQMVAILRPSEGQSRYRQE